jgi:hypothetical protein
MTCHGEASWVSLGSLEIAGIRFNLQSARTVDLEPPDFGYASFLEPTKSSADVTVRVCLDLNGVPDLPEQMKIFESDQAWSLFKDGNIRSILFKPPPLKDPLWCAQIDLSHQVVMLHCGMGMVRRESGGTRVLNPLRYPLDLLLTMYVLAEREGGIVHAAGIVLRKAGFVFLGRSGAGKSTLVRQFSFRQDVSVLSDDRVVIRKNGDRFWMAGTPWGGEAGKAENRSCLLSGLFFLRQSSENRIKRLAEHDAAERLLAAASIPWYDRDLVPSGLSFCANVANRIPAFELQFRPTTDVVSLLEEHAEKHYA